jgi:hypothetical protein
MKRMYWIMLALAAAILLLIPSTIKAADVPDSDRVSQLLAEAKTQAHRISEDASTLETYTRSGRSWESHAAAVVEMREHINLAGKTLVRLDQSRDNASPWQVIAIDRINPLLREIATNTSNAIDYLNKKPSQLNSNEYKDYIATMAQVSSKLAGLITDFVDYGHTKDRLERLSAKLELTK